MNGTPSTVLCFGLGSFSTANLLLTLGFGISAQAVRVPIVIRVPTRGVAFRVPARPTIVRVPSHEHSL